MTTFADVEKMATHMADARVYGFKKPSQVISAMLLAHESGKSLTTLMSEKHFFEDGKISQRADYTQSLFLKTGTIIWHIRTKTVVAGTFFAYKPIDDLARERASKRFKLQYELDVMQMQKDWNRDREAEILNELSDLARENEATIIRTMAEAEDLGLAEKSNYKLGAAAMLQWRCVTDAVKLINPEVMGGMSSDVEISDLKAITETAPERRKTDEERMEELISQHLADADSSTNDIDRKRFLGLAADLRTQLADRRFEQAKVAGRVIEPARSPETLDADQLPGLDNDPRLKSEDYVLQKVKAKSVRGRRLGDLSNEELEVLHENLTPENLTHTDSTIRLESQMIQAEWKRRDL